jgi:hypothetical protein
VAVEYGILSSRSKRSGYAATGTHHKCVYLIKAGEGNSSHYILTRSTPSTPEYIERIATTGTAQQNESSESKQHEDSAKSNGGFGFSVHPILRTEYRSTLHVIGIRIIADDPFVEIKLQFFPGTRD